MLARRTRARLFPLVIFGLLLTAAGAPALGGELPTADELIDKALEAMGGKAIEKVESYSASSEMTSAMGTMTSETFWVRPDASSVVRFADWKAIDGVQFFHRAQLGDGPASTVIKFVRIELNKVSPDRVALPEEVKKLAAERPAEPATRPSATRPSRPPAGR